MNVSLVGKHEPEKKKESLWLTLAVILCGLFFIAYSVLSIVRHMNYQSFGYDLGINNQVVWRYSTFQLPITTSDPFPHMTKLATHIELVYALISPFYWIWSSARTLLTVDTLITCSAGIAIFLLARKRKLHITLCFSLLFGYLAFYGIQNAMWFDVHSASFAAAFLAWFIYFLDQKKMKTAAVFCLLAISTKENIGLLTFLISFVYFIKRRERSLLVLMGISVLYLLFVYTIYFPYIVKLQYLYQNTDGLLSNINPFSLIDTVEKREAIVYSLGAFGFIPLLLPLFLLPTFGDFATYFILASDLTASHGIFMHYRVTLAPLLAWATIMAISYFKLLNNKYVALYLLVCTLAVQYLLHLPLSYLTKEWFWTEPSGVKHINALRKTLLPADAIVAQNNIIPHISQRDKIYTLYPEKKTFTANSPCGTIECDWFRWEENPTYLFVDTSTEWDARHLLINRENFIKGLENLEKSGVIQKHRQSETAVIYIITNKP